MLVSRARRSPQRAIAQRFSASALPCRSSVSGKRRVSTCLEPFAAVVARAAPGRDGLKRSSAAAPGQLLHSKKPCPFRRNVWRGGISVTPFQFKRDRNRLSSIGCAVEGNHAL